MAINDRNLFAALNENVVMIDVRYIGISAGNKNYTYKALVTQNLKVGDTVVVPANETYLLAEVVGVRSRVKFEPSVTYKWVVQRVDFDAYIAVQKQESEFNDVVNTLERDRRRNEVLNALSERIGADKASELREQFKLSKQVIDHQPV